MRYLVSYYNGRGNREKIFPSYKEAKEFKDNCSDTHATIWEEIE